MDTGRWQYEGRGGWHNFDAAVNSALEAKWTAHAPNARYSIGGKEYDCNFTDCRQRCIEDSSRVRKVRRVGPTGEVLEEDSLSDAFFFYAFQEAMRAAGFQVCARADDMFDFRSNRDYRNLVDSGKVMQRGGQPYKIPVGWKRFAVKVSHKYDNGDNTWMQMKGTPGEWAVAYHGTKYHCLPHILQGGLKAGPGQAYSGSCGLGIYCSPDLATAEGYCAQVSVSDGTRSRSVKFILQCRVRPESIRRGSDTIWVINNTQDIRPYGVLVK